MGARESAQSTILERLYGTPIKIPRSRMTDLPSLAQRELLAAYRILAVSSNLQRWPQVTGTLHFRMVS